MRTVTNVHQFLTLGDLRRFLELDAVKAMNENAFIWIPQAPDAWNVDCATDVEIQRVCTPEDGFPEEAGIVFLTKKVANKVQG